MTQQEEEWMQPLVRNPDLHCLLSFDTLFTASSNSSIGSSDDIDNELTGSCFYDEGITFGSLISIVGHSKRSTRGRIAEPTRNKKNCKSKSWFLSLCSKLSSDAVCMNNNIPSLGQFLEVERRSASFYKSNPSS